MGPDGPEPRRSRGFGQTRRAAEPSRGYKAPRASRATARDTWAQLAEPVTHGPDGNLPPVPPQGVSRNGGLPRRWTGLGAGPRQHGAHTVHWPLGRIQPTPPQARCTAGVGAETSLRGPQSQPDAEVTGRPRGAQGTGGAAALHE